MIALTAAIFALAGSMVLAALRLRTETDIRYGRSYLHVTPAFRLYVFLHGFVALLPFPLQLFWAKETSTLISTSPWVVAVATPLFVNKLVRLQGLDLSQATGLFNRFRINVSTWIHEVLIDWENSAMHRFIEPFAKDMGVEEARILMSLHLPIHLSSEKEAAVRAALLDARTVERTMEIYIRMIGKHSFVALFGERLKEKKLAPTPLFDGPPPDDFERRRQAREKSPDPILLVARN